MSALFVYGTLLVPEILSIVLGREAKEGDLVPATTRGFRRFGLPDRPYPVMRASPGDETTGAMIGGITDDEWKRLDHFEAEFYERRTLDVTTANGTLKADAYIDPGTDTLTPTEWSREAFERDHLQTYIERTKEWMNRYRR